MKIMTAPRYHRFVALHALRVLLAALASLALFAALAFTPAGVTPVRAAGTTYIVTSTADDVNNATCTVASCTLRQAVNAANANDPGAGNANTITFGPAFATAQTITLLAGSGGTLTPTRSVTIDATAGNRAVTISGGRVVRLFVVNRGVTLGLRGLTLANGTTGTTGTTGGGAILNNSGGTVNITGSTFTGNVSSSRGGAIGNSGIATITGSTFTDNVASGTTGSRGGAIGNSGTATITGSTFTGNVASGTTGSQGGAINNAGGTANVTNSTFSGNSASDGDGGQGGAINNVGIVNVKGSTFTGNVASGSPSGNQGGAIKNVGTLTLALSVVAGNSADAGPDINGTVTSGGGNVIGGNALLGTPGSYGGPVQTIPLLPGSPALDILACPNGLTTDARGISRPQGAKCDAGAFESRGFAAGTPTGDGQSAAITTQFGSAVGLTVSSANAEPVTGGQVTFTITPGGTGASATFTGTPPSGCTLAALNTVAVCTIPAGGVITSPAFTANGTAGGFTIVATASNGASTPATQSFTLTVTDSPVITSADHATFVAGTAGSFTVTTTAGYPTATTITKTGTLPAGVTFTDNGNGTATLAGTPTAAGAFPLTLTASNGVAPDGTQPFTLTVTPANAAPTVTSADRTTFALGAAGSFTVTTTAGYPTATTITKTGTLPAGVSVTDNGNGTATLAGTPTAAGSFPITLTASNGASADATQTFTLTVTKKPAITSADHATFASGTAGSFTVTTTAGYPTVTTITKTGTLPSGVSFTDKGDGTATLAGTPAGTPGSYPLTITATNAAGSTQQAFTLTVGLAAQTITFATPLPDRLYGAAPFAVTASSSSGLPVTFASSTTSVCTLSGSTVTLKATGTCTITASQAGNGTWAAAAPVARSFTIGYAVSSLAPPSKTTFQAGSTIPVKFQLVGADGKPIPDSLATSLGCTVQVSFNGGTPLCASYNSKSQQFQANVSTPANLPNRTSYQIVITVKAGTTTVATATTTVTTK
jgi:CSLREA domain-containing protein